MGLGTASLEESGSTALGLAAVSFRQHQVPGTAELPHFLDAAEPASAINTLESNASKPDTAKPNASNQSA